MSNRLKELLIQHGCPENAKIEQKIVDCNDISYKKIREILIEQGEILEEIESEKIYIASLAVKHNYALVVVQLQRKQIVIYSYAKEGIIKQHTACKAISILEQKLVQTKSDDSKKNPLFKFLIRLVVFVIALLFIVVAGLFFRAKTVSNFINKYNIAANCFNELVDEYNVAITKTCIDNVDGLLVSVDKINIEDESLYAGLEVVFSENTTKKIESDTKTINELSNQLQSLITIVKQITAPDSQWVENRLNLVTDITGTEAVTELNNPDGLLNKDGGYIACIYFTYNRIDPNSVEGESIVDKGTDAGGAVEVYRTLQEAESRCEYLSGFDGTALYSGSYAIVGTVVIRTSYKLTDKQQFELTNEITKVLTQ